MSAALRVINDKLRRYLPLGSLRAAVFSIYILQFMALGLRMLSNIWIARVLGPAEKGIVDLFILLGAFLLELGTLGFGTGLLYYLANKREALNRVHGTALVFCLLVGCVALVAGLAGFTYWRQFFPGLPGAFILLAFALFPLAAYHLLWTNIMTGINQAVQSYKVALYFAVFHLGAVFLLWLGSAFTATNIMLVLGLATVLQGAFAFGLLYRRAPGLAPNVAFGLASLRYGVVVYIGAIANLLTFRIDQLMVNVLIGQEAVGLYTVSVRWAELLFFLDSAVISAALYRISSSSRDDSRRLTFRLFRLQLLISAGGGALLAAAAYPLIDFLYGAAYGPSALPLMVLIPGVVSWSAGKILSQHLTYNLGIFWLPVTFSLAGAATNILLNLWLIPSFNILGAAVASSLSYLLVILLTMAAFYVLRYRAMDHPTQQ